MHVVSQPKHSVRLINPLEWAFNKTNQVDIADRLKMHNQRDHRHLPVWLIDPDIIDDLVKHRQELHPSAIVLVGQRQSLLNKWKSITRDPRAESIFTSPTDRQELLGPVLAENEFHTYCYLVAHSSLDSMHRLKAIQALVESQPCINILGNIRDEQTGEIKNPDLIFRTDIIESLCLLALFDEDPIIRGAALEAIVKDFKDQSHLIFGEHATWHQIGKYIALKDSSELIRAAAIKYCKSVNVASAALADNDPHVLNTAFQQLFEFSKSGNSQERNRARESLAEFNSSEPSSDKILIHNQIRRQSRKQSMKIAAISLAALGAATAIAISLIGKTETDDEPTPIINVGKKVL